MKQVLVLALMLVVFGSPVQASEERDIAGQKITESKETEKARRAKDRKEHEKYLREITRSR